MWKKRDKNGESEQRMLVATATPKERKTWEEGGINRGEKRERLQIPGVPQFGNMARCHGNAALPQSPSPHAETQK